MYIAIHYYPLIAKLIEADSRMRLNKVCSIIIEINPICLYKVQ